MYDSKSTAQPRDESSQQNGEKIEFEPFTFSFGHRGFGAPLLTKDEIVQSGEAITARCWHFLFS